MHADGPDRVLPSVEAPTQVGGGEIGVSDVRARSPRWPLRAASIALLVGGLVVSTAAALVVRSLVADQEHRLLTEKATEVGALLSSSLAQAGGVAHTLANAGGLSPEAFSATSTAITAKGTITTLLLSGDGNRFTVVAGAGAVPAVGSIVDGDRAILAARALTATDFVSGVIHDGGSVRLGIADRTGRAGAVAEYETPLNPAKPITTASTSPFHELVGSVYAAPRADPASLVFSTVAAAHPATGSAGTTFAFGADRWYVIVGAKQPLVGSFARAVPWIILAVGVLATLLASLLVETLVRRRMFALRLVDERTHTLREREATLRAVFAASPDVIHLIDKNGDVVDVSPAIERLLGWPVDHYIGKPITELAAEADAATLAGAVQDVVNAEPHLLSVQYRPRRRDGAAGVLESQASILRDDARQLLGAVVVTRDITERAALVEAQDAARQAAEQANRSKSEFLSRMSHELRTPLNAVIGFAQLLEMEELSSDQLDSVEQILRAGRHLLDLINEVLDISRIESGTLTLSSEPVMLDELLDDAIQLIAPLALSRGIVVHRTETPGRTVHVFADRQRLKQVVLNLLSNAVKYNHRDGRVEVSVRALADEPVRVTVSDTGPGIAADKLDRLFTPFDRLGAEQTDVEGTGIGLAVSQRLAESMGGRLGLDSTGETGSRFWVELPPAEAPIDGLEPGPILAAASTTAPVRRRTIVHIEDNLFNLKLVERITARIAGTRVVPALQGRLGIELTRQHHPDLVLLDVHLPDLNGQEVLRILKSDPATADIPVVMLSADASPSHAERFVAAGAAAFVTKPIDVQQLLDVLDRCADQETPTPIPTAGH